MKNWIYILYIGLVGALVSSCRQTLDEEVQSPTIGKAKITFTIALDEMGSRSRTWNENESIGEQGSEQDNQIDLTSGAGLQVLVYDAQGNYLAEVTNKVIRKISNGVYKFDGELVIDNLAGNELACRLMVYANCTDSDETFSYDAGYIPMWGVKETTLQLAKGELTELTEPIYLLRSMAKVEVMLAEELKVNLDSVTVNRYNKKGNIVPAGYATVTATENLTVGLVFNPNNSQPGENLSFTSANNSCYIYLPEYQNVESEIPAVMTVVIDGNEYPLEFKDYQTGAPFDIVRNHYYKYIITGVSEKNEIIVANLLYQSIPWTDVENSELNFN